MSKINLELGGNYTAGEMFKRANDDLKAFGKSTKDVGDLGRTGLKLITDHVDGPLKSALNGMSSMLSGIVTGGIFGLIAGAATAAFGYITEKVKEAKEATKTYAEFIRNTLLGSVTDVELEAKKVAEASKEAGIEVEKLIKTAKEGIQTDAKFKVQELHVKTLQRITDQMSEAARKVVEADEAYEAGMIKARSEYQAAQVEYDEAVKRQTQIKNAIMEEEEIYRNSIAEQARFNNEYSNIIGHRNYLTQRANETIEELVSQGMDLKEAEEEHKNRVVELSKYTKENSEVLEDVKKSEESLSNVEKMLTDLKRQQTEVDSKLNTATNTLNLAHQNLTVVEMELTQKKKDAARLVEIENQQSRAKIEKEESVRALRELQMQWEQHILDETKKVQLTVEEYNELMKVMNQGIEDGLEDQEMEAELRKKWLELMKKRNEQQERENKDKEKNDGKDKDEDKDNLVVTMSVSSMSNLSDTVEKKLNFKEWQKKNREEARKARDEKNNMKIDQAKMTKALKGEMPEAEAKEWVRYAKDKYTPEQMKDLANMARRGELLSPKSQEWIRQNERFNSMLRLMQNDDEKKKDRDINAKKTADNTEEMKKTINESLAIK